jgi:hypothetical protein
MSPMLAVLLTLAAAAPAPVRVVVLDVKVGPDVPAALGPYLTQVLAGRVAERSGVKPLVSEDVRALLGFEQTRIKLGCDSDQCLAEIAGALGAGLVVNTNVAATGSRYLVTASLLDTRKAEPVARAAEMAEQNDGALVKAVEAAADHLFAALDLLAQPSKAGQQQARQERRLPAPPEAVAAPRASSSRRTWAWVSGGGAVALAAGGVVLGASALSKAHDGDTSARSQAHLADALYLGSAALTGLTLWLWLGGDDSSATEAK